MHATGFSSATKGFETPRAGWAGRPARRDPLQGSPRASALGRGGAAEPGGRHTRLLWPTHTQAIQQLPAHLLAGGWDSQPPEILQLSARPPSRGPAAAAFSGGRPPGPTAGPEAPGRPALAPEGLATGQHPLPLKLLQQALRLLGLPRPQAGVQHCRRRPRIQSQPGLQQEGRAAEERGGGKQPASSSKPQPSSIGSEALLSHRAVRRQRGGSRSRPAPAQGRPLLHASLGMPPAEKLSHPRSSTKLSLLFQLLANAQERVSACPRLHCPTQPHTAPHSPPHPCRTQEQPLQGCSTEQKRNQNSPYQQPLTSRMCPSTPTALRHSPAAPSAWASVPSVVAPSGTPCVRHSRSRLSA